MPVSVADAVGQASNDWLLQAAARRLGRRRFDWPLLTGASKTINGRGRAFAEVFFDVNRPSAEVVEQLADYVELMAWGHTLDGWRYLSQAASALLQADRQKALHLAYYSELRGALGILASSGIAVLKDHHFAITSTGELRWFRGSTHVKAWEALSHWVAQSQNALAVIDALGVNTVADIPWLEVCRAASAPTDVASHWLQNWSFDLTQIEGDKFARNEASYGPKLNGHAFTPLLRNELELIQNASYGCLHTERDGTTPSQIALLADLCRASADFRFPGTDASREGKFWREAVRWMTNQQGLDKENALALIKYVRGARENPAGLVLRLTETRDRGVRAIFARAYFMQQLASFLLLKHRQDFRVLAVGGSITWPNAILQQFGLQAQMWSTGGAPSDITTIEEDAVDVNEELAEWKETEEWCGFALWRDKARAVSELCRFERHFLVMAAA
jgi:hypothetical protein